MKILKMLQGLAPSDREKIIQAIYSYIDFGTIPDLEGIEIVFWLEIIKPELDKQKRIKEKRSQAGAKGAVVRWQGIIQPGDKKAEKEKPLKTEKTVTEKKRFKKPSLNELQDFCKENNIVVDCERFYNYYESNDWKVGRNSMKDWTAAMRNWDKNNKKWNGNTIKPNETKNIDKYLELL